MAHRRNEARGADLEKAYYIVAVGVRKIRALKRNSIKPVTSERWIKSMSVEPSEDVTKFLPLPGGEGRGEGERKYKSVRWLALIVHPLCPKTNIGIDATHAP